MGQGRGSGSPRWRTAAALFPLVALSGAWSANAADDPGPAPVADTRALSSPAVPDEIFSRPASVALPEGFSAPTERAPGQASVVSSVRTNETSGRGIPASALSAYRRAAAILNAADTTCNIDWTLIAAIGKVESDHGRFSGSALDSDGTARPGIFGLPLDGSGSTARIMDTDDGALDQDPVYDRAVGPMQFIPGTWALAGVDADQDGVKNPQDIDDAATATGVYLCAGDTDLAGGDSALRGAVYRYNHSRAYVDTVLAIMTAYAGGDFAAVPDGTRSATGSTPVNPARQAGKAAAHQRTERRAQQPAQRRAEQPGGPPGGQRAGQPQGPADDGSGATPAGRPSDDPSTPDGQDGQRSGRPGDVGRDPGAGTPTPSPSPTATPTVPDPVRTVEKTVEKAVETLDLAEATTLCEDRLGGTLLGGALVRTCGTVLEGETPAEATDLLRGSVAEIIARLGL